MFSPLFSYLTYCFRRAIPFILITYKFPSLVACCRLFYYGPEIEKERNKSCLGLIRSGV